jgi:hypothetical protein
MNSVGHFYYCCSGEFGKTAFIAGVFVCSTGKILWTQAVKVKVKFTIEQATKAQRRSRGIALLFP